MHLERRRYPRRPLSLGCRIALPSGALLHCRVRDYCPGGLLLLCDGPPPLERGAQVRVGLALPGSDAPVWQAVRVARCSGTGIGVAFVDTAAGLLAALERIAQEQAAAGTTPAAHPTSAAAETFAGQAGEALDALLEAWRSDAVRTLRERLAAAPTAAQRDEVTAALTTLERAGADLRQRTTTALAAGLRQLLSGGAPAAGSDGGELSLVEKETFEQWLVLRTAALQAEGASGADLARLNALLGTLGGAVPESADNPLGPDRLCRAFEQAVNALPLEETESRQLKVLFAEQLERRYPALLARLLACLDEAGISPAATPPERTPPRRPASPVADGAGQGGTELAAGLDRIGRLLESLSGLAGEPKRSADAPAQAVAPDLSRLLERLAQDAAPVSSDGADNWLQRLRTEAREGTGPHLSEEQDQRLAGLEALLQALVQTSVAGRGLAPLLGRLEAPLARVALHQGLRPGRDHHPLLRIVDLLERLSPPGGPPEACAREVDQLLARLDGDDGYERVIERLEHLVAESQAPFEAARERLQRDKAARYDPRLTTEIDFLIGERLRDRDLPPAVHQFVRGHWREALRETYRSHGKDSASWREATAALDDLLAMAGGSHGDTARLRTLAQELYRGLRRTTLPAESGRELVRALATFLVKRDAAAQEALEARVFSTLGAMGPGGDALRRPARISPQRWEESLALAHMLEPGSWVAFIGEDYLRDHFRVVVVDEETGRYELVSAGGTQNLGLDETDLVRHIAEERLEILGNSELPLSQRAGNEALMQMHRQLAQAANHDPLTGLLNRRELERRLNQRLHESMQRHLRHTLCYFDLDLLRLINNSHGHDVGDDLLRSIGRLLRSRVGEQADCARMGSDEFAVLFPEMPLEQGQAQAEALLKALRGHRLSVPAGDPIGVTASMGVVEIAPGLEHSNQVFAAADSACDAARDEGGDRIAVYQPSDEQAHQRKALMDFAARIGGIIRDGELRLRCQRIAPVEEDGGHLPHYEVLLGLTDAAGGQGNLGRFITAAEMYGRMAEVDRWVIHNTFRWMCDHRTLLDGLSGLSVNLSGNSFRDDRFLRFLLAELKHTGVPTDKLIFEVTETVAVGNLRTAGATIRTIRDQGCRVSLDDFGSGLSSYSYLKSLPVDYVKIDGIFVKNLEHDRNDYAVVKSINEIAHFMGKRTIAEYVASEAILARVRELGVDYAQGFHVERPRFLYGLGQDEAG